MKFRWLQTILVLMMGTGWATAQGQPPTGTVPTPTAPTAPTAPIILPPVVAAESVDSPLSDPVMSLPDDGHPTYSTFAYGQMLFWNIRDANLPIMVTNVPVGFAPVTSTQLVNGVATPVTTPIPVTVLAQPSIPGAQEIDTSNHLGFRGGLGVWFGDGKEWGLEATGFGLEEKTGEFRLNNRNNPQNLSINTGLVFIAAGGGATSLIFPRQAVVNTNAQLSSNLWGVEANVLRQGCYYGPLLLSALTGVRYNQFEENATVTNNVTLNTPAGAVDPAGTTFPNPLSYSTYDRIRTKNQFIGVQIGVEADLVYGPIFFNARGKVALGDVRQEINVLGSTTFVGTNLPPSSSGGLLSGPGDSGTYSRDKVAFLPELNLKLGYRIGNSLRLYVGYDILYMQHVARPGGQTDLAFLNSQIGVANTTSVVNVAQPVFRLKDMDVWVQGINGGLELRF